MAPVGPLVDAVIAGAARARARGIDRRPRLCVGRIIRDGAKRRRVDSAARGAAWAHHGQHRLHRLLPEGTLDPAAANRSRLDRADAVLSRETAPTLACLAWQTRVAAATPPPESAVAAAMSEARSLAAESARLSRNVVPRPDPPLWTPMLAEAARFRDQLAPWSASPASSRRSPRTKGRVTTSRQRREPRLSRGSTPRDLGATDSTYPSRGTGTPPSRYSSPPSSSGAASPCSCPPRPTFCPTAPRRRRRGERSRRALPTPPPPPPPLTFSRSRRSRASAEAAPRRCSRRPRRSGR